MSDSDKIKYPLISIITIVFNNKDNLIKTIKSVREQTYKNIEYIIIDGGSTDGTADIIKENTDIIYKWVSEPDKGIYDAMNKGLRAATGDYVLYMNAGDEIYSPETLSKIIQPSDKVDFYYGDTELTDTSGKSYGKRTLKTPPDNLTWKKMIDGMVVTHQSIIAKRVICPEYDLKYPYCADIDWTIKVLKKSKKTVNTKKILSKFLIGGYSRKNTIKSLKERYRILRTHFNIFAVLLNHVKLSFKFGIYIIRNKRIL